MATEQEIQAKVDELEKSAAQSSELLGWGMPERSTLEGIAREILAGERPSESAPSEAIRLGPGGAWGTVELWSWWGWKMHLTRDGLKKISDAGTISTLVDPAAGAVAELIKATLAITVANFIALFKYSFDARIALTLWVAGDDEVDLYSPWCAILAMIPVKSSTPQDQRLNFSVAKTNLNWSDGLPFVGAGATTGRNGWVKPAAGNPALGTYSKWNQLWCVYHTESNSIEYSIYNLDHDKGDVGWSDPKNLDAGRDPGLCEYNGYLYLVYRTSYSNQLMWRRLDRGTWNNPQEIPEARSTGKPSLTVYNGKLLLVARDEDGYPSWMPYDRDGWSEDFLKVCLDMTSYDPGVATFNNRAYVLFPRADDDDRLYACFFDGKYGIWSNSDELFPSKEKYSAGAPGLAVFDDKLYCVYRRAGKDRRISFTMFDGETWSPEIITQNSSDHSPAVMSYTDHQTNEKQELLIAYRS